jgi:hypothetical protein
MDFRGFSAKKPVNKRPRKDRWTSTAMSARHPFYWPDLHGLSRFFREKTGEQTSAQRSLDQHTSTLDQHSTPHSPNLTAKATSQQIAEQIHWQKNN